MKKIFLITLITMLNVCLFGQISDIEFENYTTSDGLSTNWNISSITQDSSGYLWFATSEGLNRFDGYEIKVFQFDPLDSTSLISNNVVDLLIDSKQRMWVGLAYGGLALYNPKKEEFINFWGTEYNTLSRPSRWVNSMVEDESGNIWLAGDYLIKFDPEKETFMHFRNNPEDSNSISVNFLNKMTLDSKGYLWIGAAYEGGLNKYDKKSGKFHRYTFNKDPKSIIGNKITSIYEDENGTLLVGTDLHRLYSYNYETDKFIELPKSKSKSGIFSIKAPISTGPIFGSDGDITLLERTSDGRFWISATNGGLKVYNKNLSDSRIFSHDETIGMSLSEDYITTLYEDNQKNIWLGTISRGIMRVVQSRLVFKPTGYGMDELSNLTGKHVRAVFEDSRGVIWVGTIDGILIRYNPNTKVINRYYAPDQNNNMKSVLSGGDIDAFYEDELGKIWIGTFNGIDIYDPQTDTFKKFKIDYDFSPQGLPADIEAIIEDDDNNLWIGIWNVGVLKYNKLTKEYQHYRPSRDSTTIMSDQIYILYKDQKGKIWVGTNYGLCSYQDSSDSFSRFLIGSSINSINEDKDGTLWIGSNKGLYAFDQRESNIQRFTKDDGLPSNFIAGILIDDEDNLWLGTASGLVRFEPKKNRYLTYNEKDGSQSDLFETANSHTKTSTGLFLFGSSSGLTIFNPKKIEHNSTPPNILISELRVFDTEIDLLEINDDWRAGNLNEVTLRHTQNEVQFEYVGIHFKNPERNKYSYMLEPYDQNWHSAGTQRSARYTSLNPGEYVFKVKAANSDGVWSEDYASMNITILPPWWQTWWAFGLYAIGFISLLGGARKFELDRRKEKENKKLLKLENDRKSKELEEARQLQLSMLPKQLPKLPQLDIAVYMKTATEVGGDYYDFHVGFDGTLTAVIGDATGHGLKAGTMVTSIKSLFNSLASLKDIQQIFHEMTRCIKQMHFDKLLMSFTMLKINERKLQMSAGGMPPIYIFSTTDNSVKEFEFKGMPLGTIEKFPYQLVDFELNVGDTIFLTSDGLPELENENNKQYGYKRLRNKFEEFAKHEPDKIIELLNQDGNAWLNGKEPNDDITFVVIKVK